MSESDAHKKLKKDAPGEEEVPIGDGRRLDSASDKIATEVELSGDFDKAVKRLKDSGRPKRVLLVKKEDMQKAAEAMKRAGVKGTVRSMTGTDSIKC